MAAKKKPVKRKKTPARKGLRVLLVYMETFWTENLGKKKDPYEFYRVASDLPLGAGSVKAYAEKDKAVRAGCGIEGRTFPDQVPIDDAIREIVKASPDIVGFTMYIWNAPKTLRMSRELKKVLPGVRILVGGPEVPRDQDRLRAFLEDKPEIDVAVSGEGEAAFREILKAWIEGGDGLPKVKGIAYRDGGKVSVTDYGAGIEDLAVLPSPFLAGSMGVRKTGRGMVSLETSRGCPFRCAFCDYHAGRRKMRFFPLKRLERELDFLIRSGFEGLVYMADPFLNMKKDRTRDIFRILSRWKHGFQMELNPKFFDDELIEAVARIPKAEIALGIQSINPETLKNINRDFDLAKVSENIRKMIRYPHLTIDVELILGLPGDDYEVFKRELDWAMAFGHGLDVTLFDLVILPNSPLASMKEKFKMDVDEEGLVRSSYSFSREDMKKASWLFAAYLHLTSDEKGFSRFIRGLEGKYKRPSEAMEEVGARLVREGVLPDERVIGQGGQRRSERKEDGKPKRWVELSKSQGVEYDGWW